MSTYISLFLFVFLFVAAPAFAQTNNQTAAKGNATISGHVSIEDKNAEGVLVLLKIGGTPSENWGKVVAKTKTDREGNFQLTNLPAGSFNLIPQMPAYVITNIATERRYFFDPTGKAITLKASDEIKDVNFVMARGGVVTGRVTDSEGKPAIRQKVSLWRIDEKGNKTAFRFDDYQMGITDDRGIYRYFGLPEGKYAASVGVDTKLTQINWGRRAYFPQTFYPNTQDIKEAEVFDVAGSKETTDIDIRLAPRGFTYTVSGRMVNEETNQPITNGSLGMSVVKDNKGDGSSFMFGGSNPNDKGEFKLAGVFPGRYLFKVMFYENAELYSEGTIVEVKDADVDGIVIKAKRGQRISGIVTFENTSTTPLPIKVEDLRVSASVSTDDNSPNYSSIKVAADGSFTIGGLRQGKVSFYVEDWRLKGVHLMRVERGGAPMKDGVIELAQGETVDGVRLHVVYGACVLRGEVKLDGTLAKDMRITVSLKRKDGGRLGSQSSYVQVDSLNRFIIDGLPPGEYEVTATVMQMPPMTNPYQFNQEPKTISTGKQSVTLSNGVENNVTINLSLSGSVGGNGQ